MMVELLAGKLWVGDAACCKLKRVTVGDRVQCIVHACKTCHMAQVGQLEPNSPKYLAFELGGDCYANLIDAGKYFQRALFESVLRTMSECWKSGRPIRVHCDQGRSRAPMICLLFMAKVLCELPDTSLDDAWDAWEKRYGKLNPSHGLEDWLRANWHAIAASPLTGPRQKFEHYQFPDMTGVTAEEAVAFIRTSPIAHFATMVTIENKRHERETPRPNILQMRINEAYQLFCMNGMTIRIIVTKPRQSGSTTFVGHIFYHHARTHHVDGMCIADEGSRTIKTWQIFTEYSLNDKFAWDSTFEFDTKKAKIGYADGSTGQWETDTANDSKVGIGGTRQAIWYSESARYAKSGARSDEKVMSESLSSMAKVPHSMAILESTAEGAFGVHYDTWQQAISLEDFRAQKYPDNWNGWVKVFAAWFEFAEHSLERRPENARYFKPELSAREARGVALYGWDANQIAWRRFIIAEDLKGNESLMDQNYPEDEVSCFLTTGSPRFSDEGMTRLEIMAKAGHDRAMRGVLSRVGNAVEFFERSDDAWLFLVEKPISGCAYIGFLDPCWASQSSGSKDPDSHAAGIVRDAYMDRDGTIHPKALVAVIDVLGGCRWDATLIAERLTDLAKLFGECLIVPEVAANDGIILKLQEFGANIYQRQKFDAIIPGKTMNVLGWESNSSTRKIWVEALADAIREQSFDCVYLPAVREFRTFVVVDGKAAAAQGKHDDFCAGLGIALACIKFACVFRPAKIQFWNDDAPKLAHAFS